MEGQADPKTKKKPSLKDGAPQIVVATSPTELIVTKGSPEWAPLEGTQLLYVKNTTGNVFKDLSDQQTYVLVTGRWFRAPDFSGPGRASARAASLRTSRRFPTTAPRRT